MAVFTGREISLRRAMAMDNSVLKSYIVYENADWVERWDAKTVL